MKTAYVCQTRKTDKAIKVVVTRAGTHHYDGQGETAIYAHEIGKHGKWYAGYGGDYIPATKEDIANIDNVRPVSPDDERGY